MGEQWVRFNFRAYFLLTFLCELLIYLDLMWPRRIYPLSAILALRSLSYAPIRALLRGRCVMDTPMDIRGLRATYLNRSEPFLLEDQLPTKCPFGLFDIWFKNVAEQKSLSFEEINAVSLSTVGKNLRPSSRMVLMKAYDSEGFSFFTYVDSKKGKQMSENENVALLFYWPIVHRQIRIEGEIKNLPESAATEYWETRPVASRIGSKSSTQSSIIPSRDHLLQRKAELEQLAANDGPEAITKPKNWQGFKVIPRYFEFWQGQSDRLHDRIVFDKESDDGVKLENGWTMYRLSP